MASQSSSPFTQSFTVLRVFYLIIGIYPFHPRLSASSTRFHRILNNLLLIYCSLLTIFYILTTIRSVLIQSLILFYSFEKNNVNYFAFQVGELAALSTGLLQMTLLVSCAMTSRLVSYADEWRRFDAEYETLIGRPIRGVAFWKPLLVLTVGSVAIVYMVAGIYVDYDEEDDVTPSLDSLLDIFTYSMIFLRRFYTELLWNTTAVSLSCAGRQLVHDYAAGATATAPASQLCHFEQLWCRLANLQNGMATSMEAVYGVQLAVNFLQVLFQGFGWHGYVSGYFSGGDISLERLFWIFSFYRQVSLCALYIWIGSITADSAQKAIGHDTKKKILVILSDTKIDSETHKQAKQFLQKVTFTKTAIKLGGYGTINRDFFCKVLLAWVNYMIVLLQFRMMIQSDSKVNNSHQHYQSVETNDSGSSLFNNDTFAGFLEATSMTNMTYDFHKT